MSSLTISDLPTEVIESFILPFLSYNDVQNLGRVGNRRLKEIAVAYSVDNKSKFTILIPLQYQLH